MYMRKNYVSQEQAEYLLSRSAKKKIINEREHSNILRELKKASFETLGFKVIDGSLVECDVWKKVQELQNETDITVDDLCGWWLYDPNLWLYEKSGQIAEEDIIYGIARKLSSPSQWFEDSKSINIGKVTKHTLFVKYSEEVENALLNHKSLYFIKSHVSKKNKKSFTFALEETEDFEKIISIKNRVSNTVFYYGVW